MDNGRIKNYKYSRGRNVIKCRSDFHVQLHAIHNPFNWEDWAHREKILFHSSSFGGKTQNGYIKNWMGIEVKRGFWK